MALEEPPGERKVTLAESRSNHEQLGPIAVVSSSPDFLLHMNQHPTPTASSSAPVQRERSLGVSPTLLSQSTLTTHSVDTSPTSQQSPAQMLEGPPNSTRTVQEVEVRELLERSAKTAKIIAKLSACNTMQVNKRGEYLFPAFLLSISSDDQVSV